MMIEYVLLVLCILTLGVQSTFDKLSLRTVHFAHFAFVKAALCALAFPILLYVWFPRESDSPWSALAVGWVWCAAGVTVLGSLMYYKLMKTSGVAYMTMTWPAMMVVSIVIAAVILKEEIPLRRYVGISLALVGSVIALL
jgi:drug/metabolite transporter (DMT)-like permease